MTKNLSLLNNIWQIKKCDERTVLAISQRYQLTEELSKLLILRNIEEDDIVNYLNPDLNIDLPNQTINRPNGVSVKFDLDPFRKKCLLEGLDDISLTLEKKNQIESYESYRNDNHPWL